MYNNLGDVKEVKTNTKYEILVAGWNGVIIWNNPSRQVDSGGRGE